MKGQTDHEAKKKEQVCTYPNTTMCFVRLILSSRVHAGPLDCHLAAGWALIPEQAAVFGPQGA